MMKQILRAWPVQLQQNSALFLYGFVISFCSWRRLGGWYHLFFWYFWLEESFYYWRLLCYLFLCGELSRLLYW